LKEKCTDDIVGSANNAFNFAILFGHVWTGKAKQGAVLGKTGVNFGVINSWPLSHSIARMGRLN
jgi:hypothetical protein